MVGICLINALIKKTKSLVDHKENEPVFECIPSNPSESFDCLVQRCLDYDLSQLKPSMADVGEMHSILSRESLQLINQSSDIWRLIESQKLFMYATARIEEKEIEMERKIISNPIHDRIMSNFNRVFQTQSISSSHLYHQAFRKSFNCFKSNAPFVRSEVNCNRERTI